MYANQNTFLSKSSELQYFCENFAETLCSRIVCALM